ncbi:MAG: heparinase II/III family protein [Alphaproteobacteria bacterium]|nr:heparinase II/III family protein [Alphaproteobacteria bacterium]
MSVLNKIEQAIKSKASHLAYNSPLYNWSLGGTVPNRLLFSPTDLWPGNSDNAKWLIYSGEFTIEGDRLALNNANWHPEGVNSQWLRHIHGFSWLRDFRALGGHEGRQAARAMIQSWISAHPNWDEASWHPRILGKRLGHWLAGYDFFGESADDEFQYMFLDSTVRQLRHLSRSLPAGLYGLDLLEAIKALAYGGLTLEGRETYLEQALNLLDTELDKQILSDGGPITRNPETLLQIVRLLIDLRAAMNQARYPAIEKIQHTLDRAVPALRFFRHGDGAFGLFNDAQENNEEDIKKTVMHAGSRARTLSSLPQTGYERIAMGRSLLLVDTGKSTSWPYNKTTHHAPLSFEFSHGRERIFVNCGTHPTCPEWQEALRSTPAHNTLILDDSNIHSAQTKANSRHKPHKVTVDREQKGNSCLIDIHHDGYLTNHGITHRRRFYLSEKGFDLRGEDNLTCTIDLEKEHDIAIRFHLHPKVMVSLVQGDTEALLRLKNGVGWRFTITQGALALENSIYLGEGIRPRKTKQLVIRATLTEKHQQYKWALQRE